jgi:hypothetical protein
MRRQKKLLQCGVLSEELASDVDITNGRKEVHQVVVLGSSSASSAAAALLIMHWNHLVKRAGSLAR